MYKNASLIKTSIQEAFNNETDKFNAEDFYNAMIDLCNLARNLDQKAIEITGLTGGSATDLNGLETVDVETGQQLTVSFSGKIIKFELVESSETENAPFIIRPGDYSSETNERVWKRTDILYGSFVNADLDENNDLEVQHDLGFSEVIVYVFDNNNRSVSNFSWIPKTGSETSVIVIDLLASIEGIYSYLITW